MTELAEIDSSNIVQRVLVFPDGTTPTDAASLLGGVWVVADGMRRVGPGCRFDGGQMWPWGVDLATGSLWCLMSAWLAVPLEDRDAYAELTGLTVAWGEIRSGVEHVVFGGRAITEEDQIALAEVLG